MTRLRAEERFCDVTIVARSLRFRGHRVILAACSPFLRDQFLLNPAAELRVSLAHSARVLWSRARRGAGAGRQRWRW
uniref:BTB domain-containing protein n=1 Tax=Meleagris gallopavo TaxID=9103 RepID=A0A803YNW8_MELGA